jgi:hypothetical protein
MSQDKQRVVSIEEARRTAEWAAKQAGAARRTHARASELVRATRRRCSDAQRRRARPVDVERSSGEPSVP